MKIEPKKFWNMLLNFFKKNYLVTFSECHRGNVNYQERKMIIRAFNGWEAWTISKDECGKIEKELGENKNWVIYDIKKI